MKFRTICFSVILVTLLSCGKKMDEVSPIRQDITETVFASGILEAKNTYELKALSDGYIEAIYFEAGDLVQKGDLLAVIDNKATTYDFQGAQELFVIAQQNTALNAPLIAQAKNAVDIAKLKMDQEGLQEQRYKNLLTTNSVSRLEYETVLINYQSALSNYNSALEAYNQAKINARQSEISNRALKDVNQVGMQNNQLAALVPGKVYERLKEPGDYVRKGDPVAIIGSPDQLYASVNIDESNIKRIALGQETYIQLNTNTTQVYKGEVSKILPAFNNDSQSFICEITFKDSLDFKIINTQLEVNIITNQKQNALLIPRRFIDYSGQVLIKGETNRTTVKTNIMSDQYVEITEGIDETTVLLAEHLNASN